MVPIERSRDIFPPVIGILERFGFQKKLNGFLGPPHAAQFVAVHVLRMRNLWRHLRVDARLFKRVWKPSLVLIAVRQKMMCGEIIGRDRHRPLIVSDCRSDAAPSVAKRRGLLGMPAKQEQLYIVWICGERVIDLFAEGQ